MAEPLPTSFPAHPVLWSLPALYFCYSPSSLGENRFLAPATAGALFLASILAWVRPRWRRQLTLSVGILLLILFVHLLILHDPSLFVLVFLLGGVWEVRNALSSTENADAESEDDARAEASDASDDGRRPKSITELLTSNDASELMSVVFDQIVRRYGNNLNVMALKEHERVFILAYNALGIIGNGGFNYLFEQHPRGDPHFKETAAAFNAIGCEAAVEAFARAFSLFPRGRPPRDVEKRLRQYRSGPGEARGAIDKQFFDASEDIEKRLLAFLQAHGQELAELDSLPPLKPRKKRKRGRATPPTPLPKGRGSCAQARRHR